MYSNICIKAMSGGYVILFSRNNKKPHTITKKTTSNSYLSLIEGCQRAFKLARENEFVFRPSDMRVLDVFNRELTELDEPERELRQIAMDKNLTIIVKPAIQYYEDIMDKELNKKIQ